MAAGCRNSWKNIERGWRWWSSSYCVFLLHYTNVPYGQKVNWPQMSKWRHCCQSHLCNTVLTHTNKIMCVQFSHVTKRPCSCNLLNKHHDSIAGLLPLKSPTKRVNFSDLVCQISKTEEHYSVLSISIDGRAFLRSVDPIQTCLNLAKLDRTWLKLSKPNLLKCNQ